MPKSKPQNLPSPELCINVIRGLAMDAPHKAKSGHQGTAMALAPLAHVLWTESMKYDAKNPDWPDRDRFILSAGHASILQYAMLYLTGYGLTLDDLKDFRQFDSLTPGHPERSHTAGVEVTTGPLGQGFANGVGMAIAEKSLRARFGSEICDHFVFAICSDGDLAEGVSHEAASLAGHLGLEKLIYIYDDNRISIDGTTDAWLSDDPVKRFESYGWDVTNLGEAGEDTETLSRAIEDAKNQTDAPCLIVVQTHIAHPSPDLTDNPAAHGYALFDEEIAATKKAMGLPEGEIFFVPDEVLNFYRAAGGHDVESNDAVSYGSQKRIEWEEQFKNSPKEVQEIFAASLSDSQALNKMSKKMPAYEVGKAVATRSASGECLKILSDEFPQILAGGADLTGNTGTKISDSSFEKSNPTGRQIYFGVREHAMGSLMVGMACHGGIIPVGGTFLVFSDYMRPAIRLAALSNSKAIFVFTHDSVGVGEDGPTHQPIEQIASLRAIPELTVIRPADAKETVGAWICALECDGPVALILTRQNVETLAETKPEEVKKGAYLLSQPDGEPDIQLLASGSEVQLAYMAAKELAEKNILADVVSVPSFELFFNQPEKYQQSVLKPVPRVSIEAGTDFGWHKLADDCIGINRFGASAPGAEVMEKLGINISNICERAVSLLSGHK